METINLIYIGEKFYQESGTMMGVLYHETGTRSDWGKVTGYLRDGNEVHIRPATENELAWFEKALATDYPKAA